MILLIINKLVIYGIFWLQQKKYRQTPLKQLLYKKHTHRLNYLHNSLTEVYVCKFCVNCNKSTSDTCNT